MLSRIICAMKCTTYDACTGNALKICHYYVLILIMFIIHNMHIGIMILWNNLCQTLFICAILEL